MLPHQQFDRTARFDSQLSSENTTNFAEHLHCNAPQQQHTRMPVNQPIVICAFNSIQFKVSCIKFLACVFFFCWSVRVLDDVKAPVFHFPHKMEFALIELPTVS